MPRGHEMRQIRQRVFLNEVIATQMSNWPTFRKFQMSFFAKQQKCILISHQCK